MIRRAIRRWLGVPSYLETRAIALAEADADAVWKAEPGVGRRNPKAERRDLAAAREIAIRLGHRENPGA